MSKRGVVTDIDGNELYEGDVILYATRHANRARLSQAVIKKVTTKKLGGRLIPWLEVQPTGVDSGFTARRSLRKESIGAEHVGLMYPGNRA